MTGPLIHICPVDFPILINRTSPFRILEVSCVRYHFYLTLDRKKANSVDPDRRRLIRFYTVCLGPKKGHQANMG